MSYKPQYKENFWFLYYNEKSMQNALKGKGMKRRLKKKKNYVFGFSIIIKGKKTMTCKNKARNLPKLTKPSKS